MPQSHSIAVGCPGAADWEVTMLFTPEHEGIRRNVRKFIDAEIRFRACAPKALRRLAQLLKHAQRVQLTIRFVHENKMRTRGPSVKPLGVVSARGEGRALRDLGLWSESRDQSPYTAFPKRC